MAVGVVVPKGSSISADGEGKELADLPKARCPLARRRHGGIFVFSRRPTGMGNFVTFGAGATSHLPPCARWPGPLPRVLIGWPLPLGLGLDGRLLLATGTAWAGLCLIHHHIITSGGDLIFRRTKKHGQNRKNAERNAAFLAFLPVLLRKTGKNQPGAALEHLE